MNDRIIPITDHDDEQTAPRLTIDPSIAAPDGSVWASNGAGYSQIVAPWAVEQHVGPIKCHERLGDVESWVEYVTTYGTPLGSLLTWSLKGLVAVLDFHSRSGEPNRCQWRAEHPFETTRQWQAWMQLANNRARSQKELIEALEEHRLDVKAPDAATLVGLIRALRANVNVAAESSLEPNGNTKLTYSRNTTTSVELPPHITIGIPVLKGHTAPDANGVEGPVRYELDVLVRVDMLEDGDKTRVAFRLTIPNADQALEDAVADRVAAAKALLGDGYQLLRATA